MQKIFFFIAIISLATGTSFIKALPVSAMEEALVAIPSAKLETFKEEDKEEDKRVIKLRNFLKGYPLKESAEDFITIGDKYALGKHIYLVAAISCVESTCGIYIPYGSYNAWGFGIPTGAQSGIVFNSWEEGIERVTETIVTNPTYRLNKIKSLDELSREELVNIIGPVYAASPAWPWKVRYFMEKIENTPATPSSAETLTLDL